MAAAEGRVQDLLRRRAEHDCGWWCGYPSESCPYRGVLILPEGARRAIAIGAVVVTRTEEW